MAKKVLVVLSGYGYWGEELIGPLEALQANNILSSRDVRPLIPTPPDKSSSKCLNTVFGDMAGE